MEKISEQMDYINKLNPNEHHGYNVCFLRSLKESLIGSPERAKIAIEIRDFVRLNLYDYNEGELTSLSLYFYGEFTSINHFLSEQIKGMIQEIESKNKYISSIKNKKDILFWTAFNAERKIEIEKYKSLTH